MSPARILLLGLVGVVFAVWAFLAFRSLFRLAGLLRERSGKMIPGVAETLSAPRIFLTDHLFRQDRKYLGLMTLLMLVLTAVLAKQP